MKCQSNLKNTFVVVCIVLKKSFSQTWQSLATVFAFIIVPCRWMNKMGLAAISYDASHDDTTAGFIRPSNPSSPTLSDECRLYYNLRLHLQSLLYPRFFFYKRQICLLKRKPNVLSKTF